MGHQSLTRDVVSCIDSTVTELQHDPSALWGCIYHALQWKIDFHLQMLPPQQTEWMCEQFDAAILRAAEACGSEGMFTDQWDTGHFILRRLYLATRMRGGDRDVACIVWTAYFASVWQLRKAA